MANIQLRDISRSFGTRAVLSEVSLEVHDSEFMVFVGPSGCGKSTLLRTIAGFEQPDRGEILIDGERMNSVPPGERQVAMVFQSYALYPHMTAEENIGFCLKNLGFPKSLIQERVRNVAQILQIEGLLARKPHEMSGGQRQRVAIGRAVVRNPKLFLFDEPLSNLDALLRVQMRIELARLHQRLRTTMIYVTHDQVEAMTLADRIAVMNAGRIEQVGAPLELYHRPANLFVAGFLGSPQMNLLPARIVSVSGEGTVVRIPGGYHLRCGADASALGPEEPVTVGIRPEQWRRSEGARDPVVQISVVERLGNRTMLYGTVKEASGASIPVSCEQIAGEGGREISVRPGELLRLTAPPDGIHLFDARGIAVARRESALARSA